MQNLNAEQVKKALECCKTPLVSDCENCSYTGKRLEDGVYEGCMNCLVGDALALINSQEQRIGAQDITISELRKSLEKSAHDAERYERKVTELTEERKDFEIRALRAENEAAKYKDRYETEKQAREMLSESYDHLEKTKDELLSERSRLIEENERLQKNIETYRGRLKSLKKEFDNLDEKNKLLIQNRYGIESYPYSTIIGHKKMLEYRIQFDPKIDLIEKTRADTVREMQERLIEELYKVAHCRHGDEYNMKSPEVFGIIDQIVKEMSEGENKPRKIATNDQHYNCDFHINTPEILRQRLADIKRDMQKGLDAQNLRDFIIYLPLFALYSKKNTGNLYVADELIKEINKGEAKNEEDSDPV